MSEITHADDSYSSLTKVVVITRWWMISSVKAVLFSGASSVRYVPKSTEKFVLCVVALPIGYFITTGFRARENIYRVELLVWTQKLVCLQDFRYLRRSALLNPVIKQRPIRRNRRNILKETRVNVLTLRRL